MVRKSCFTGQKVYQRKIQKDTGGKHWIETYHVVKLAVVVVIVGPPAGSCGTSEGVFDLCNVELVIARDVLVRPGYVVRIEDFVFLNRGIFDRLDSIKTERKTYRSLNLLLTRRLSQLGFDL